MKNKREHWGLIIARTEKHTRALLFGIQETLFPECQNVKGHIF